MRVLLIGGTDSSGGAGLARDIATTTQMGAATCIAVTAVTAQTNAGVSSVHPVPTESVAAQIQAAGRVSAVKIGMLGSAEVVAAVAEALPSAPLVLDPVLMSSSGYALLSDAGLDALIADLLPRTTLLTPNLPELGMFSRRLALPENVDEGACVRALITRGCRAVLVKGGHAEMETFCEDRLYLASGEIVRFRGPRFGIALRGTGCELASAISVTLGEGGDPRAAVCKARTLVMSRFHKRLSTLARR